MIATSRRGALAVCVVAAITASVAVSGRAAENEVVRTFKYDTAQRCYIDSDIRFCGFPGGVGTVTLRGAPNSRSFLLTIKGQLQPQVKMNGTELLIVNAVRKEANDKSLLVHRIRPGDTNHFIDETVQVNKSRFRLRDITDVRIRAVSVMPPDGQ